MKGNDCNVIDKICNIVKANGKIGMRLNVGDQNWFSFRGTHNFWVLRNEMK